MRLWSFHPKYLDDPNLRLLWRHGLKLNRMFEAGEEHPQLLRFTQYQEAGQLLSNYLHCVVDAGERRGLRFKRSKIPFARDHLQIPVTSGQLEHEIWLYAKVLTSVRGNGEKYVKFFGIEQHEIHPIFHLVSGAMEFWEKLPPHDYPQCVDCGDPCEGKRKRCEHCRPSTKKKTYTDYLYT